jgi:hypothetical protein
MFRASGPFRLLLLENPIRWVDGRTEVPAWAPIPDSPDPNKVKYRACWVMRRFDAPPIGKADTSGWSSRPFRATARYTSMASTWVSITTWNRPSASM